MKPWTSEQVAWALGTPSPPDRLFTSICTDTRTLLPGSLFVALVGEKFDGHRFLEAARDAGAAGAVVNKGTTDVDGLMFFEVDDTLHAYGRLARYRRRTLPGPVVAITGTNGKTSTKEMLLALLRTKWKTHGTRSNNNNRVGVPLTILEAPDDTEALVLEAGANQLGEIALLREIIEPSTGVITNVAAGHLEGFNSVAGVLEEKMELVKGVPAVVGEDPPILQLQAREHCPAVVVAGLSEMADVAPERWSLDSDGCGVFTYGGEDFHLSVPGEHQLVNAMLALAAARLAGVDGKLQDALGAVELPGGRCEVINNGSMTILNDTYNANPRSLSAVLRLAKALQGGRRIVVVVGSMLELGEHADVMHRDAATEILELTPDVVGATGDFIAPFVQAGASSKTLLVTADDVEQLGQALRGHLEGGELVVLKASRGVGLERVIPFLAQN